MTDAKQTTPMIQKIDGCDDHLLEVTMTKATFDHHIDCVNACDGYDPAAMREGIEWLLRFHDSMIADGLKWTQPTLCSIVSRLRPKGATDES